MNWFRKGGACESQGKCMFSILCLLIIASCGSPISTRLFNNPVPRARADFLSQCGSNLTQAQYQQLLRLSDVSTFHDYTETAMRAEEVARIFANAGDRRGVFSSMYVEITKESVRTAGLPGGGEGESYEHPLIAQRLVKRFAELYFQALHGWLMRGQEPFLQTSVPVEPKWEAYYRMAEDCDVSAIQLLGTGVNNHMTFDLPYALRDIDAPKSFEKDFYKFGEILIRKEYESTELLKLHHGINAVPFFNLYLDTDNIPPKLGSTVLDPSLFGFRYVRFWAWIGSRGLLDEKNALKRRLAESLINGQWHTRQMILRGVPIAESILTFLAGSAVGLSDI